VTDNVMMIDDTYDDSLTHVVDVDYMRFVDV
jgi:hypothetical protein